MYVVILPAKLVLVLFELFPLVVLLFVFTGEEDE
jgi:hypothetical protein